MQRSMQHLQNKPGKGSCETHVQDFCSSDLGMVPVRDMNTETARQMPEDLHALSDAVKAFVWSWVTLTFFSLKTSPKDGK